MSRGADETRVARVAACAVGLAFAARSEGAIVRELLLLAEHELEVLAAAARRVAGLEHLDHGLRTGAIALLELSVSALHQDAALTPTGGRADHPPTPRTPGRAGEQAAHPATRGGATGPRPPAAQEQ